MKTNLTRASRELFRRSPDESFGSLDSLIQHCEIEKESSRELWIPPDELAAEAVDPLNLRLKGGDGAELAMNEWSFSQLCRLCGVHKGTVNRLKPDTASRIFRETIPGSGKPLQVLATDTQTRAIHGASYTRMSNADLLQVVRDEADQFKPPPTGITGGTGLYCGEQDMFCFLIDPNGWVDIEGEQFAPGFFIWNSEVGRRSLGMQSFWCQRVCGNHIVWDAIEVVDYSRKHTANVGEALDHIRTMIQALVSKRDERRDAFANAIGTAMTSRIGSAEEAIAEVTRLGIPKAMAEEAITMASTLGELTVFGVFDAVTRLNQQSSYAGDRAELDSKAARLLSLAA